MNETNIIDKDPLGNLNKNVSYQNGRNFTHYDDFKNDNSNTVLVLYLGGTIGMWEDDSSKGGLRAVKGELQKSLKSISQLKHSTIPKFDLIEFKTLKDSSNVTPNDWITLAKIIYDKYYQYHSFVILHGTDTLAYSASALSFIFSNLSKTIIFTGAVLPLNRPISDGLRNLSISLMIAANLRPLNDVCIFMDRVLLRGNCSYKYCPNKIDAFISPNIAPLAEVSVHLKLNQHLLLPAPVNKFSINTNLFLNVIRYLISTYN